MRKIPTIFKRDWKGNRSLVLNQPHGACAWVFNREGIATRKLDGTACLVRSNKLYRRRELRKGDLIPLEFEEVEFNEETKKTVGWVPVGTGPEDKWHREAFNEGYLPDGTYELVDPRIQGNPEQYDFHILIPHGHGDAEPNAVGGCPRSFDGLRDWFCNRDIIVFHHLDGRMAKIKKRDFGLKRTS